METVEHDAPASAAEPTSAWPERRELASRDGRTFKAFRATLRPRFVRVWLEIGCAYAGMAAAACVAVVAEQRLGREALLLSPLLAFVIGYFMTYLQTFFHEAAHYNVARGRRQNDWLANLLIGSWLGQNIGAYRLHHFDHHRYLGTVRDPERTYFEALSWQLLFELASGVKVLRIVLARGRATPAAPAKQKAHARGPLLSLLSLLSLVSLVLGMSMHLVILGAACFWREWTFVAAWLLGIGSVLPTLSALRQVLEHRDENARADIDYRTTDQGECNRLFGSGPIASTFGGAGFNRHLLHHLEPQISYTCFRELDAFLATTAMGPALDRRRTTYWQTFRTLFRSSRNHELVTD